MIYYIFCVLILIIFFFFLFRALFKDFKEVDHVWLRLSLCAILAIVYKYDFGLTFCGLEYEDAYAFSFLAREFANGIYTQSFLSEGIGIGSIESPVLMQTYGGHFITYSVLLSLPVRIFGFSFSIISITTCLLQFLSLLILSVFPRLEGRNGWIVAPVLYCISPIINVFGNSFLCEPFSGLVVLSFIYLYCKQIESKNVSFATMIALFVAILTKRENLVLLALPVIHYAYLLIKDRTIYQKKEFISIMMYGLIVILYLFFIQNVFNIESTEAQDIESSTFSLSYFTKLAPAFVGSLINPLYFGITTIILVVLIIKSIIVKAIHEDCVSVICIWLLYFLLYTFHYRGYFFVQGEAVSAFDTFRYLNNFYCLTPVIICMLLRKKRITKYMYSLFGILLLLSVYQTTSLRYCFNNDEWANRFEAPQKTLDIIKNEKKEHTPVVISPDILTLQNIGDNSLFVCDAFQYDMLEFNMNSFQYYLLCRDGDIEYLKQRYEALIDLDEWRMHTDLGNGFKLYVKNDQIGDKY